MKNSSMNRTTRPLVSLLIPTFNRADYLGQALDSALAQDYPHLEIIVHDDASTDYTPEVLSGYHDPRLRIIQTKDNHGMIGGWNYIVKQARGKYIKFLASDDLLAPTCVTRLVASAIAHSQAALITCQRRFIDGEGRVVKTMGFARKNIVVNGREHAHWILTTLRQNLIGEPTAVLYPRALVKKAGEYDPQFSQFADFEYWIRLLQFGDLVYLHEPLCSFRQHASSNTSAAMQDGRFIKEIFALIRKYSSSLTPADRAHVTRLKTLDTLKNIKDLLLQFRLRRASQYTIQLLKGINTNHQ